MTTTKTITVSLADSTQDETVSAAYFQIEDGWITFKTDDGKAVVAYPEKRVTRIKTAEPPVQLHANISAPAATAAALRSAASRARWAERAARAGQV